MSEVAEAPAILIVDDEASIRRFFCRILEREGYAMVEAESAEDAVNVLKSRAIAVVMCDVGMPGAGGAWLAAQVSEHFRTTAVVFATGDGSLPVNRTLIPGVVGYLVKPISPSMLLDTIETAVLWHRAAARKAMRS